MEMPITSIPNMYFHLHTGDEIDTGIGIDTDIVIDHIDIGIGIDTEISTFQLHVLLL